MNYIFFRKNNLFILFVLFYLSLIIGFIFNENLNFGALPDWEAGDYPVIKDLSLNFKETLLNYESYGHRHSPVYLIFLSLLKKIGFSFDSIRFINLNISLLLIFFFYKCLIIKFDSIEKKLLFILSLSIFLSPTFRSLAIWPSSRIIGLIFFVVSIYEFLKFLKTKKKKYIWKNIFFLILSSYISPNFSVFIIFFGFHYWKNIEFKYLFQLFVFCLFCSIPAFYYLFYLDINFLLAKTPGSISTETVSLSFNFSNKILLISSIIFFHLSPFLIDRKFLKNIIYSKKKNYLLAIIIIGINIIFFDYSLNYTGGGIFFQISNIIFDNNIFFYILSFLSLLVLIYLSNENLNNFLIFFILIISNIQNTIYHKYYDPLVLILFFTLLNTSWNLKFFKNKNNIIYVFGFYIVFILMRVIKNYFY
tara:strand:- start:425 stop:1681 length:1257 start_codon:yes stop_codon:yes gene_type:complete